MLNTYFSRLQLLEVNHTYLSQGFSYYYLINTNQKILGKIQFVLMQDTTSKKKKKRKKKVYLNHVILNKLLTFSLFKLLHLPPAFRRRVNTVNCTAHSKGSQCMNSCCVWKQVCQLMHLYTS